MLSNFDLMEYPYTEGYRATLVKINNNPDELTDLVELAYIEYDIIQDTIKFGFVESLVKGKSYGLIAMLKLQQLYPDKRLVDNGKTESGKIAFARFNELKKLLFK